MVMGRRVEFGLRVFRRGSGAGWGGKIWGKSAGKKTAKKRLTLHAGEVRKQWGRFRVRSEPTKKCKPFCGAIFEGEES